MPVAMAPCTTGTDMKVGSPRAVPAWGRPGRSQWLAVCVLVPAFLVSACLVGHIEAYADGLGYEDAPPQEICGLCHSLDGISRTSRFPKLAGQKPGYIAKQLADFLAERRANDGGQMSAIVTEIKPRQFDAVAAYFAGLAPPPPVGGPSAEGNVAGTVIDIAAARRLFLEGRPEDGMPACASCHVETNPAAPLAPYLTAQHSDYLVKQLRDFREGRRANDVSGTMQRVGAALSDGEIVALAHFLSRQPRGRAAHEM